MWSLPLSVEIDGVKHKIRNNCDYRVVLDVIKALNDEELPMANRIYCALYIFYEDFDGINDYEQAIKQMMIIVNNGEEETKQDNSPILMDWEYDFKQLVPPINKVLGYSVRMPDKFTHWYDFIGAYMEIDNDCTFSTIISIRYKKQKHKKLEKWEEEFCREHPDWISLPQKFTQEEEEFFSLFEQKGEI
jgi:hypothetical protein